MTKAKLLWIVLVLSLFAQAGLIYGYTGSGTASAQDRTPTISVSPAYVSSPGRTEFTITGTGWNAERV